MVLYMELTKSLTFSPSDLRVAMRSQVFSGGMIIPTAFFAMFVMSGDTSMLAGKLSFAASEVKDSIQYSDSFHSRDCLQGALFWVVL